MIEFNSNKFIALYRISEFVAMQFLSNNLKYIVLSLSVLSRPFEAFHVKIQVYTSNLEITKGLIYQR